MGSLEVIEKYEPLEEGLDEVVLKKRLSLIKVKLTKTPTETDKAEVGFSAALEQREF